MTTDDEDDDLELLDQLLADDGVDVQPAVRIPPRPITDRTRCALSYQQHRLWFLHELEPASASFNVSGAIALRGTLDVAKLATALDHIVARHEALRTTFAAEAGVPWQYIAPTAHLPLAHGALGDTADEALGDAIRAEISHETARPFELARGPLIRARLLACRADHHVLIVTAHHIICDGWSIGVFMAELAQGYAGGPALAPLPLQYGDYAHWQRQLDADRITAERDDWAHQLADLPHIWLPWDHARPTATGPILAGRLARTIDRATTEALRRIAGATDASLATALLAGYAALLHRYAGQPELAIGLASSNRSAPALEGLIGFFVNMLVIRADLSGAPSFRALIGRTRDTTVAAMARADVPFETLVERVRPDRHMNRHPLFQVSFVFQNLPDRGLALPGLTVERIGEDQTARFDLELFLTESAGGLGVNWVYDARLFDRATIASIADAYACVLAEAVAAPDAPIDRLRLVPAAEAHAAITAREQARTVVVDAPCLHELFAATAARFPDHTGLVDGAARWRYRDLEAAANRLAHRLIAAGIAPGARVGLYRRRGADLALSILAILKAGAAYVPIDPRYPDERVRFILEDSGVAWVIADEDHALPASERYAILALPASPSPVRGARAVRTDEAPPRVAVTPDHVAYVIYTSGSTGTPKGCLVRHRNVVRLMRATEPWFGFDDRDVWTLFHSAAFDFSVWELWGAWCYGGRLVIVPYDTSRDPAAFYDLLCTQRVTVLNQTPSAFKPLIEIDRAEQRDGELALRCVIFGGEALAPRDLLPWIERHGDDRPRLVNMYGITETTVHVTYRPISEADARADRASVIGVAIPDLAVHVLDAAGQPVPRGAIGELYVSGAGVAQGYLDRPELTQQRFVASPLSTGERWYRTGDLGRWRADGDLEYHGRIDHQVKIRGFRIELGEIRACLRSAPAVRDGLVVLDDHAGDPRLLAYAVPDLERLAELRGAAARQVDAWRDTFDATYSQANPTGHDDFNTVGWQRSGGGQIADDEMREWLDDTLAAIRALAPRRVLEIGCGTGMLLQGLAPASTAYVGLDFSATTLDTLAGVVARRGLHQVELHRRGADDLAFLAGQQFDTIILNSIIQYFPDREYLLTVLRASAGLLAPGGTIFVGDVRNLALLDAHHASLAGRDAAADTTRASLAARVRLAAMQEEELLLDPAWFTALADGELPGVRGAVLSAKPGRRVNELTKYRYDVFLRREPVDADTRARLARPAAPPVLAALRDDAAVLAWLAAGHPAARIGELSAATAITASAADSVIDPLHTAPGPRTNQPALAQSVRRLAVDLRDHLRRHLPDYMVPAHLMMVDAFPVTAHGKIDVAALPRPSSARPIAADRYVPPAPGPETALAELWCQVLGLERVGRDDGFFALGGHSLLATQLIARVNQRFATQLPLRAVFEHQTLAAFAAQLADAAPAPAIVIPRAPRGAPAPLSFGQRRLWFLDQLAPGQAAYNTMQAIDVRGALDVDALDAALATVIARHAVLRTVIGVIDDEPRQLVREPGDFALARHPGAYAPDGAPSDALRRALVAEAGRPFALDRELPLRAAVYSDGGDRHTLLVVVHHIAIDGWSLGVLVHEFDLAYAAHRLGTVAQLPALPVSYADFAAYQRDWLASPAAAAQRAHWLEALRDPPAPCSLPHDMHGDGPAAATAHRTLGRAIAGPLAAYAARHHTTPFTVLASALALVLHRLTGAHDLVIGAPIAQRNHPQLEPLIGFFVNTLALRARPRAAQTFAELAADMRRTVLDAFSHQDYPFELLVEDLAPERDGAQNPLFQVMLVVQNQAMAAPRWDGARCEIIELAPPAAKLDLTVFAGDTADGDLALTAEYRTACYRGETIDALLAALEHALVHAVAHPETALAAIPLAPSLRPSLIASATAPDASVSLIAGALAPATPRFDPALLTDLIAAAAARFPDAPAILSENRTLSYRDLDHRSNALAHALVTAGAGRERPIAVITEPCPDAIVAMLAILKAGSVYLPLDPRHPDDRLRAILDDARPVLAITDRATLPGATPVWRLADLDVRLSDNTPLPPISPRQLAYLIYTSGSTGVPKAAMLEHAGLANLAHTELAHYGTRHGDRVLLAANLTFDASVSEIANALASGATLVIIPRDRLLPDDALAAELRALAITWWTIRPSFLALMRDRDLPALRTLIIAGESLDPQIAAPWLRPGRTVFNAYGPTEATVCASVDPVTAGEPITIGRGLDDIQLHVLDRGQHPIPDGLTGELYLGGAGVGRGYLDRPALTAERFVPDPFSSTPGARMYRTGDLARRRRDGRVECLGRTDFQIKLRGYRIDPGDLEARLRQLPGIDDAVVTVHRGPDASSDALIAHLATALPADQAEAHAFAALRAQLADYMIPRWIVALPALPLGRNGKLDRRALPPPALTTAPATGDAPRSALEWQLSLCFEHVLGRAVGVDDSFFALGGHSFLALRLVSELGRVLGRPVPVGRVFTHPTVRALATTLADGAALPGHAGVVPLRTTGDRPPLFLVHQAGGYIYSYFALARQLAADRPIYGLQPPGLDDSAPPLTSVPALARHHVHAMRAVQPHGPYHLAGHSLGGVIAYEMARQLVAAGERVAYLGLIDSQLPSPNERDPVDPRGAFGFLVEQIEAVFGRPLGVTLAEQIDAATAIDHIAAAIARLGIADLATARAHVAGLHRVFIANVTAYRAYRGEPCPVAAWLYQTDALRDALAAQPTLAWSRWALGGVTTTELTGDHLDVLADPALAAAITAALAH